MSSPAAVPVVGEQARQRVLGRCESGRPGPTVIALGGIHGNEPAGVQALERVVAEIGRLDLPLFGSFIAFAGNLSGLAKNQRFLDRDLNRAWTAGEIAALRSRDQADDGVEDREQRELLDLFEDCLARANGPVLFVDLHTSSADGESFSCLADTIPNRRIAMSLPVPTILGLEESIDGSVLDFFSDRGLAGLAIEGGQHSDPRAVDNLEAGVWLVLLAAGVLVEGQGQGQVDGDGFRRTLRASAHGLPPVFEVRHRHVVKPGSGFVMEPGFRSFLPVAKGQLLAREGDRELRAGSDGRILLPLYQGLGEDGYFLCRSVRPFWLNLARVLRLFRVDYLLRWVPGVRPDPQDRNSLLVDPRVARFLAVEIFHLLGFRRRRKAGELLRFARRRVRPNSRELRPRRRP